MKVISNTSPLIGFAKIKQFSILKSLFRKIVIPIEVYKEFFGNASKSEEEQFHMIFDTLFEVQEVSVQHDFSRKLGNGEAQVLSLAIQEQADLVIIDDKAAFKEAKDWAIEVVSTRSVLKLAEVQGLIQSYDELEKVLMGQGFYPPTY